MKHAIVGTMTVKPGARDSVLRILLDHRDRSLRDEPGTLQFEVLVPLDKPCDLILLEVYASSASFDAHFRDGTSIAQARKELSGLVESLTIVPAHLAKDFLGESV